MVTTIICFIVFVFFFLVLDSQSNKKSTNQDDTVQDELDEELIIIIQERKIQLFPNGFDESITVETAKSNNTEKNSQDTKFIEIQSKPFIEHTSPIESSKRQELDQKADKYYDKGLRSNDIKISCNWYHRAAEIGHVEAQNRLGDIYSSGCFKISKDNEHAIKWYRKAAEQGHKNAQINLDLLLKEQDQRVNNAQQDFDPKQEVKKIAEKYEISLFQKPLEAKLNPTSKNETKITHDSKPTKQETNSFFNLMDIMNCCVTYDDNDFINNGEPKYSQLKSEKILDQYDINYIFHMTHIDNLKGLLTKGIFAHCNTLVQTKIDNEMVNNRRNVVEPIYGKKINFYVPFYFNPKNAMLYTNKDREDDIIFLVVDRRLIFQNKSLFTDGNAASNSTKFYDNLGSLKELDWGCLGSEYWNDYDDGKRKKMAEVLIPKKVESSSIMKIYCKTYAIKNIVDKIVSECNHNAHVEIHDTFYFSSPHQYNKTIDSFKYKTRYDSPDVHF